MPKYLVSPREGGEVIECDSIAATHAAIKSLGLAGSRNFNVVRTDVVCDFCSRSGVSAIFSATPDQPVIGFQTATETVTHMDGDGLWGACRECEALVMSGNRDALCERSLSNFPLDDRIPLELIKFSIASIQSLFFQNWDRKPGKPLVSDDVLMGES
jgi:hypothetical protein